ncbi:MAG TPA: tryptophan-rich sensory protein [Coriobacteriia bacterium]|jgi:hypothetical protein
MPPRSLALRAGVALTTALMVAGNVLVEALRFGGLSTADISALYPVLVTPAGYVFAIWGLIYLGMIAYSFAQFAPSLRADPLPDHLAVPLVVSNVANVAWLVAWHDLLIPLSLLVMLVLLASLIAAYVTARRDRPRRPAALELWAVRGTLSVYLGWISVATIANVSIVLYSLGWRGAPFSQEASAAVVLVAGALVAGAALAWRRDAVFAAVFVWAYVGIGISHLTRTVVVSVAWGLALGIGAAAVLAALPRRRPHAV